MDNATLTVAAKHGQGQRPVQMMKNFWLINGRKKKNWR